MQGRARRSGVVVDGVADERRVFDDGGDGDGGGLLWLATNGGVALTQRYHSFSVHHTHLPPTLTGPSFFPHSSPSSQISTFSLKT